MKATKWFALVSQRAQACPGTTIAPIQSFTLSVNDLMLKNDFSESGLMEGKFDTPGLYCNSSELEGNLISQKSSKALFIFWLTIEHHTDLQKNGVSKKSLWVLEKFQATSCSNLTKTLINLSKTNLCSTNLSSDSVEYSFNVRATIMRKSFNFHWISKVILQQNVTEKTREVFFICHFPNSFFKTCLWYNI